MDGIFGKFSLYDFMGIWGPGAITLFYFSFTLYTPITDFLDSSYVTRPSLSENPLLILLYTIAAYIIGMMLHELGHWFNGSLIAVKHILEKQTDKIKQLSVYNDIRHIFMTCDEILCEIDQQKSDKFSKIETQSQGQTTGAHKSIETFSEIITRIKCKTPTDTLRIDKYHAVYAMARSLMLMSIIHFFACSLVNRVSDKDKVPSFLFYFDFVLFVMFFVRTCRCYSHWVETVYIQNLQTNGDSSQQNQSGSTSHEG